MRSQNNHSTCDRTNKMIGFEWTTKDLHDVVSSTSSVANENLNSLQPLESAQNAPQKEWQKLIIFESTANRRKKCRISVKKNRSQRRLKFLFPICMFFFEWMKSQNWISNKCKSDAKIINTLNKQNETACIISVKWYVIEAATICVCVRSTNERAVTEKKRQFSAQQLDAITHAVAQTQTENWHRHKRTSARARTYTPFILQRPNKEKKMKKKIKIWNEKYVSHRRWAHAAT